MIGAGDMVEALLADGDQNKDSKIDFDGEWRRHCRSGVLLWHLYLSPSKSFQTCSN